MSFESFDGLDIYINCFKGHFTYGANFTDVGLCQWNRLMDLIVLLRDIYIILVLACVSVIDLNLLRGP